MSRSVQISSEGEIQIQDTPIKDVEFGQPFLRSLHLNDSVCFGEHKGETVVVEAKSQPLVVQEVQAKDDHFLFKFKYDYEEPFYLKAKDLYLDDWSRVCGFSQKEVPFVFSRKAQSDFFMNVVEPIDAETFKWDGEDYELEDWYKLSDQAPYDKFWTERYDTDFTPWDLNTYHKALDEVVPRLKLTRSKILVPGCGRGHDAKKLSDMGHKVTGLDFSDKAIEIAQNHYKEGPNFIKGDVFRFDAGEGFDHIFEHTLFCAINPSERRKLVKAWVSQLREDGCIFGVFNVSCRREGPPFGITEWELEELLEPYFKINMWGRLKKKESSRMEGKELFLHAKKRKDIKS